ncbi:DUF7522 family protein [Halorarius halobius]|uniref:DUF7522 family protein n=1 Tax=Halorarius halobius TaxID=2962671 RepID=UPI0020CEF90D|nr:hypothetical protein [Halorarius halobius]
MHEIQPSLSDSLVSACRTAVGDSLRTVIWFTPDAFEVLYVRSDIGDAASVARRKEQFVESERAGFGESYRRDTIDAGEEPGLGDYEVTVRVFSDGFLSRVIVGEQGVLLTTDGLDVDVMEELSVTLRRLLADVSE